MTGFLLLALAASLVLLVLEGAWLIRVPPEKYRVVIRRSIYVGIGIVVLGLVAIYDLRWIWAVSGVAIMFGELVQIRIFGDKSTGRPPADFVQAIARLFQSSLAAAPTSARGPRGQTSSGPGPRPRPPQGMTRDQARRVLGLNPTATEQDVKEAHRRLMSRVHPDKGGSAQQAAQINRAKDILLEE